MMRSILFLLICFPVLFLSGKKEEPVYDIVIYGGTSSGIAAAVQAVRMNKRVIIIEPTHHLGGLTTGGLGATDIGNKMVIGGISREFYKNIKQYYDDPKNWKWQDRKDYTERRSIKSEDAMWTFEPSAAKKVFQNWIDRYKIRVVYGERIIRKGEGHTQRRPDNWSVAGPNHVSKGIVKKNGKIAEVITESGSRFRGRFFIDASYEGDLMAGSGVSFTVGREGFNIYRESLNGVRTNQSLPGRGVPGWHHHQFEPNIDPYITKGDPDSGLLPMINKEDPGAEGMSDHRVQAYCYRMCLTDCSDNKIAFEKPEGYREIDYELLFRNFEAGFLRLPWINSSMPNRKTDTNNQSAFSTDFIGANYKYPEASYAERKKIREDHLKYQQGLMWTLANHPRIPESIRDEISKWGLTKDEFVEGKGWQDQLYIREARRMISDVVMTQSHCQGEMKAERSIGMGAYGMDSHHTQRYVDKNGYVKNEGDVQVSLEKPYPIDYYSIIPKRDECKNLLVPVCLSSSHIAYGSIRMEPVFMILGQSAATAACIAIDQECTLQDVNYTELRSCLLKYGQILQLSDGVKD
ncbi:MAG: FAD-dependent oxidoreductase [Mangrovibacterium sp.]